MANSIKPDSDAMKIIAVMVGFSIITLLAVAVILWYLEF